MTDNLTSTIDKIYDGTQEPRTSSANMKKTLFIGLGGSGKEVLMRLRRKFYNNNQDRYGYDFIRYLWIDTDTEGPAICDENWAVIGENINFGIRDGIDEVFNASIERDILSSFYDRISTYPHIKHWFPADQLRPLGYGALLFGAKGIRPLGRLAFSWHSSQIMQVVQNNISKIDCQFNIADVQLDNEIDVYVVGSLAGGTGSGMFLELAKMLKANWPTFSVYGVFFLSDMFSSVSDNQYRDANCYAALQELDFYQTPGNSLDPLISRERFMFEFVDSAGLKKRFNLPLYSNVFLVTNEYYKAPKENIFSDPFEMVAEILYYDFDSSEFGALKRKDTVNTRTTGSQASVSFIMPDPVTNEDIGVESSYSSDYSAFALSGIFLNITKMKNWAAYKYIVDLLSNLQKNNPLNRELFENPDSSFCIGKLSYEEMTRQITHGSRTDSLCDEFINALRSKKQSKLDDINSKINFDHTTIDQVQQICHQQFNVIELFINDEKGKINRELVLFDSVPGPTLEKMNNNLDSGILALYAEIEKLMYKILANYQTGGISVAEQMLSKVKSLISQMDVAHNNYINEARRNLEALRDVEIPQRPEIHIDSRLNKLLQRIQDCDEIPWVFPGYKSQSKKYFDRKLSHEISNMNKEIKQQISAYFNSCLSILEKRFEAAFKEKLGEEVNIFKTKVLEIVDSTVILPVVSNAPGMNKQIREYRNILSSLHTHFVRFELSLRTEITAALNRKMIMDKSVDKDHLYADFLRRLNGDGWFASKMATMYFGEVNQIHGVNMDMNDSIQQFVKILSFYGQISNRVHTEIKTGMKDVCRGRFDEFMQEQSVMDALNDEVRTNAAPCSQSVRSMLDNFNFRLALSQNYTNIKHKIETTSMVRIVGLPEPNPTVETFLSGLGNVKNFQYHNSRESILFYSETFGYPLFMLKNIDNLRHALVLNVESSANNKYHRYTDIVTDYLRPLVIPQSTDDMKNILHCWEVLFEAIVLRVISYDDKTWSARIVNPAKHYIEELIDFGKTLESAVVKLNNENNKELLKDIRDRISDVFAEKYNESDAIKQIWYALRSNFEDVNKYIKKMFDNKKPTTPQEYVLHKLLNKYRNKYAQSESITDFVVAEKFLAESSKQVINISSGYQDSVHCDGLKIYPFKVL